MANDYSQLSDKEVKEDIRKLVIERIKAVSDELEISIGSKTYSKSDILKSLEKEDELGKEIIEIQMEYLKDMARGAIYQSKPQ